MDHKFVNARSPLRNLEKALKGGLGSGKLALVAAAPGVGKTPFLVGVALDELLLGGSILHVALDQTVAHVRVHYDAVYDDLAETTHLDDPAGTHQAIDRRRSIRAYPSNTFSGSMLREAVKVEGEAGNHPSVIVLEGVDFEAPDLREALADLKALAGEINAEVWLSMSTVSEAIGAIPSALSAVGDLLDVVLALEPSSGEVGLRALKVAGASDLSEIRLALDPRTLLIRRT